MNWTSGSRSFSRIGFSGIAVLFALGLCSEGCGKPLKSDQKAEDAVTALAKLQARVEVGIQFQDYVSSLGEVNFRVKEYLSSEGAKNRAEFSDTLTDALRWYSAGQQIWERQDRAMANGGDPAGGYCDPDGLAEKRPELGEWIWHSDTRELCKAFPELIRKGDAAMSDGQFVLPYTVAKWDAWKRTAFDLRNAQHLLNGEPTERATAGQLQTSDQAYQDEIQREAVRGLLGN